MFRAAWSWLVPLVGAAAVFAGVLLTTPPGLGAVTGVLFGSPRGPAADAAAYTLGSAASLALVALVLLGVACAALDLTTRLKASAGHDDGPPPERAVNPPPTAAADHRRPPPAPHRR
ncbi:MAG TPA: hypothetical protein VF937_04355 [Chloroflexota bacterium]